MMDSYYHCNCGGVTQRLMTNTYLVQVLLCPLNRFQCVKCVPKSDHESDYLIKLSYAQLFINGPTYTVY